MRDRINAALKTAMKDKDQIRVSTLRLICAALKEREIAQRSDDDAGQLDSAVIMQVLAKMVKQREESAKTYEDAGRPELASREKAEMKIIREFLPKPLSADELDKAVADAIRETEATSIKDMGKVMGALKSQYGGRMDFGAAGAAVKNALA
ncbi:MAG: GatB/YqeY domain-containing protein [Pseudomonadota bacterium]